MKWYIWAFSESIEGPAGSSLEWQGCICLWKWIPKPKKVFSPPFLILNKSARLVYLKASCFGDGSHLVVWRCSIDCMNSTDAAIALKFLISTIDQREGAQMWHLRRMLWRCWMLPWHNCLDYWSASSQGAKFKFSFNQALAGWLANINLIGCDIFPLQ